MRLLENIEPKKVMYFFEELSARHRCSQHEKQATDWVAEFAGARGLTYHRDELQNIIVKKPGTPGYENAPTVILHGHLDMVCKLAEGVTHDFATEGVKLKLDGNFIRAEGTTLGADNGLGISYMLTLLDSEDIPHPPLECVMTAMEEMGKVGGDGVDVSLLTGKRMIDFNWIEEKQLLAGCSGDVSCRIDIAAEWQPAASNRVGLLMELHGLRGGHCEFDIDFGRGNAIVLVGRLLRRAMQNGDVQVASISGGVQNNVIPADSSALMWVELDQALAIESESVEVAAIGGPGGIADVEARVAQTACIVQAISCPFVTGVVQDQALGQVDRTGGDGHAQIILAPQHAIVSDQREAVAADSGEGDRWVQRGDIGDAGGHWALQLPPQEGWRAGSAASGHRATECEVEGSPDVVGQLAHGLERIARGHLFEEAEDLVGVGQ